MFQVGTFLNYILIDPKEPFPEQFLVQYPDGSQNWVLTSELYKEPEFIDYVNELKDVLPTKTFIKNSHRCAKRCTIGGYFGTDAPCPHVALEGHLYCHFHSSKP